LILLLKLIYNTISIRNQIDQALQVYSKLLGHIFARYHTIQIVVQQVV